MVERKNIESTLIEHLTKLGLNEKEKADFVKCEVKNFKNRKLKVIKGNFLRKNGFLLLDFWEFWVYS